MQAKDVLPFSLMLLIALVAVARVVLVLADWPSVSSRVWPWLRTRTWWPVASDHAAETLLRKHLTPEQYQHLAKRAYLEIPSPNRDGRTYRIPRGPGQVMVVEHGHVQERLCLQPTEPLPEADVILMHKLLIEADEPTYLATANHFPRSNWH
ncbi:MAG TPA: hypothetical protein VJR48_09485 [Ktedonobacterales bacterium]|nr:hypothetical protein [Ktedonobacterales bacterium]